MVVSYVGNLPGSNFEGSGESEKGSVRLRLAIIRKSQIDGKVGLIE